MGAWLTFSHLFSLLGLSTCGWAWAWGTILETARLSQETQVWPGGCQVEDQARGLLGASFQRRGHGPSPAPRPAPPPVGSPEASCTPHCSQDAAVGPSTGPNGSEQKVDSEDLDFHTQKF